MPYIILKKEVEKEKNLLSSRVDENYINFLYSDPDLDYAHPSDKVLIVGTKIELNVLQKLRNEEIDMDVIYNLNDLNINITELEESLRILKNSKENKTIYTSGVWHFWNAFFRDNIYSDLYGERSIPKIFITTGYLRGYGINGAYRRTIHAPKRLEQIARDREIEFHLIGSLRNSELWGHFK